MRITRQRKAIEEAQNKMEKLRIQQEKKMKTL